MPAVELEIRDGDPWWRSPDLWTVPGDDPEGPTGQPVAGQPCYVWARVTNHGGTRVENATVNFYWANPGIGFDRNTANPIGTAYVTLAPGATEDVLCLTPWMPEFVNNGHECILGEAYHPSLDPLPTTTEFQVEQDRHVAQRNLSVLQAPAGFMMLRFDVHNASRKPRSFVVRAVPGRLRPSELKALDLDVDAGQEADVEGLGFVRDLCPDPDALGRAENDVELELDPGARTSLTLVGRIRGGVGVVDVEQITDRDRREGGLTAIVVADGRGKTATRKPGGTKS